MLTPVQTGRYVTILSDGRIHEKVAEGTDGAVLRQYETSSGEKGEKWELIYKKLEGYITKVEFEDGDFGENLLITFKDGETEIILAIGVSGSFGEDLLKKLPAVDFSKRVGISPYAFENEKGRMVKGVSVWQESDKVLNFFYDFDAKKELHGFPVPEGDTSEYKTDDWKIHFIKVRKFLTAYAKEHIVPKFADGAEEIARPTDEEEQRKLAESIPF